jgi:hypothetical protein
VQPQHPLNAIIANTKSKQEPYNAVESNLNAFVGMCTLFHLHVLPHNASKDIADA